MTLESVLAISFLCAMVGVVTGYFFPRDHSSSVGFLCMEIDELNQKLRDAKAYVYDLEADLILARNAAEYAPFKPTVALPNAEFRDSEVFQNMVTTLYLDDKAIGIILRYGEKYPWQSSHTNDVVYASKELAQAALLEWALKQREVKS